MSARRSKAEALKPIHKAVRYDDPAKNTGQKSPLQSPGRSSQSPGRSSVAPGDALTWRPWCVCSPVATAPNRTYLELQGDGTSEEASESPVDILKGVIQEQLKDIEEQMKIVKSHCIRLSSTITESQKQGQEHQGKQQDLLKKIEQVVRGFGERLEEHWQDQELKFRTGGLAKQMTAGKLPDSPLRRGNSKMPQIQTDVVEVGKIKESANPEEEEQEIEEPKDVEMQLPKHFKLRGASTTSISSRLSKIGQLFSTPGRSSRLSSAGMDTEESNKDIDATASDKKKKKSVKSRRSEHNSRKSRRSSMNEESGEKKKRKQKELSLDREDDDISLFLVADKVDVQALVDQELERWDLGERWKQRLMPTDGVFARRVGSKCFKSCVNLLILVNVVCIAVQGEHAVDRALEGKKPSIAYLLIDTVFCGLFFLEIALRFLAERIVFFVGPEWRQNLLDFAFVASDIVNQLFTFVLQGADISYVSGLRTGAKMVRLARAARALRLFRVVRGATRCRLLLEETAASMSLGFWLTVLLWVLLMFFGIFFMQAAADSLLDPGQDQNLQSNLLDDFGSSPEAVFTLFMLISGGKTWSDTFHDLLKVDIVYAVVFIAFVVFTTLLFLNVVTSIFVESAHQRSRKHEVENKGEEADKVRNLLKLVNLENTEGFVGKKDFIKFLTTPFGKEQLMMLGLENAEALGIYELLDKDEKKKINIEELASGCARFTQPVRSADNVALLLAIRKITKEQRIFADYVQQRFTSLFDRVELAFASSLS